MSYRIEGTSVAGDEHTNPYSGRERRMGAWRALLDSFEQNLDDADSYLDALEQEPDDDGDDGRDGAAAGLVPAQSDGTAPGEVPSLDFAPPTDLGELPSEFGPRARAIMERQKLTMNRLSSAACARRKHARAAGQMRQQQEAVPRYFDLEG